MVMHSFVLTWPIAYASKLNEIFAKILATHEYSGDIRFGYMFTRIHGDVLDFLHENADRIASELNMPFNCVFSRSPLDGTSYGAIQIGAHVGSVHPLPPLGMWYAALSDDEGGGFELCQMISAELSWIGVNLLDPGTEVIQISPTVVLMAPDMVEALDGRRLMTNVDVCESARRRVVTLRVDDGPAGVFDLVTVDRAGVESRVRCAYVDADGMRLG
jgi:hypothetical protein